MPSASRLHRVARGHLRELHLVVEQLQSVSRVLVPQRPDGARLEGVAALDAAVFDAAQRLSEQAAQLRIALKLKARADLGDAEARQIYE